MRLYFIIFFVAVFFVALMPRAWAVPPPDFLFSVGASVAQLFSVLVLFLSAMIAILIRTFKVYFYVLWKRPWFIAVVAVLVLGISFGVAYFYSQFQQNEAYEEWIDESKIFSEPVKIEDLKSADVVSQLDNEVVEQSQVGLEGQKNEMPVEISHQEFKAVIDISEDLYVLDAREDEEFEIGRFPGSVHIRYADLLAGDWQKLPRERVVYVFCWSGIRGIEVANFLRSQGIRARYIERGADSWVAAGGKWDGGIKFSSKYKEQPYQRLVTLAELKVEMARGTVIVDSRHPQKYERRHIPGSINIAVIYTASKDLEAALSQVGGGSSVITVCDDFVSCFDAKLTGVKLEKRGIEFLGRYNKPWEFNG